MKKYILSHFNTSTPSYFCGCPHECVQVMIDNCTTYADIKKSLIDCETTEHIEDFDDVAYNNAVDELFSNVKDLNTVPACCKYMDSPLNEEDDEYYESVYMYFSLQEN